MGRGAGRMDGAEPGAARVGDGCGVGLLLCLEMAPRELLQAAQKPRPAVGTWAAGDRSGGGPPPARRGDGRRDGLAPSRRAVDGGAGTEVPFGPAERPSDEAEKPADRTGAIGRAVGLAVDADVA